MMKLTMLGTGNALVSRCYNTCFVLHQNQQYFLVDGGGGNGLFAQLQKVGIDFKEIHDIFVTHKHTDHILGIVWLIRWICQSMHKGQYQGEARIYAHDEVIDMLQTMSDMLLHKKQTAYLGQRVHLIPVAPHETRKIIGHDVTFFDIQSTKAKQFGFTMQLDGGKKLTCCGDEPCQPCCETLAQNSDWLLHEAFCLEADADKYKPKQGNHSTVKDACEIAQKLGIRNLVLYHTEDDNIQMRKTRYLAEGAQYFEGNLYVPDDLETLCLKS